MILQSREPNGRAKLKIELIGGQVLGRADSVNWGRVHPFGWDKLDEALCFFIDRFKEAGLTQYIIGIKEKWGYLRVSTALPEPKIPEYRAILKEALDKWPGLNRYLEPDDAEEIVIFEGTEEEADAFFQKTLPMSDADIAKLESKETQ